MVYSANKKTSTVKERVNTGLLLCSFEILQLFLFLNALPKATPIICPIYPSSVLRSACPCNLEYFLNSICTLSSKIGQGGLVHILFMWYIINCRRGGGDNRKLLCLCGSRSRQDCWDCSRALCKRRQRAAQCRCIKMKLNEDIPCNITAPAFQN